MQQLGVSKILAVSSCKGGVGKSSVALRLALALRSRGLRIGLLDVDVHGPSLPALVPPMPPVSIEAANLIHGRVRPLRALGLECMSWGFFPQDKRHQEGGAATVLRGSKVGRIAVQMAIGTQWDVSGPLDVLVLDMPPGTGDIHMALMNAVPLTAAVVVSTPSPVTITDVEKGVEMLGRLAVPILGLIENYAWDTSHVSKNDVCTALRQWISHMPPELQQSVRAFLAKADDLALPPVETGRRTPFGSSLLPGLLDFARKSCPSAAGFQIPLLDEMKADNLAEGGAVSNRVFSDIAEHVEAQLALLPPISRQDATLLTGDPSVVQLQSWARLLHNLKYSHYVNHS